MSDWRAAKSILALRTEVNEKYPNRPKGADGIVGDQAHASRTSDHNPNAHGVVTAWDITTDVFTDAMAEWLRLLGRDGDGRVKYVIYQRRITSAEQGWKWAAYSGTDPHTGHIHLSVAADPVQYDRTDTWHFEPWHSTPEKGSIRASAAGETSPIGEDPMKLLYAPSRATCLFGGKPLLLALNGDEVAALAEAGTPRVHVTAASWDTLDRLSKRLAA